MGRYNPHYPQILGQEWVGVRDEVYPPDTFRELGYTFTTTSSRVVTNGRFYLDTSVLSELDATTAFLVSVYPTGMETATGPVGRVVIPVSFGSVSGGAISTGSSIQQSLADPDGDGLIIIASAGSVFVNFSTTLYAGLLNGKRILRVNILGTGFNGSVQPFMTDTNGISHAVADVPLSTTDFAPFTVSMGEVTPLWKTTAGFPDEIHPFQWSIMDRLSNVGLTPRINFELFSNDGAFVQYLVLEIYYCNETRVLAGALERNFQSGVAAFGRGMNYVTLRGVPSYGYPTTLPAGTYTVTLTKADYDNGNS